MAGNSLNYDGKISLNDYKSSSSGNAHQVRRLKLINRLLDKVPQLGSALDYGCGLGDLTYRVSSRFETIIGVDVTPERVEWANKEFAPVKFQHCAEDKLDFPDSNFDTVLSSVVINWVDSPDRYLSNIQRTLKQGGHLVILIKSPSRMRSIVRKMLGKSEAEDTSFKIENMVKKLKSNGFDIIDLDCYYEPPSEVFTNPKNVLIELMTIPMRILKLPKFAYYYGVLARKE